MVDSIEERSGKLIIDSPYGTGLAWTGPALVDGRPWPVRDNATLWITPGRHEIEPSNTDPPIRIEDFNGALRSAVQIGRYLELAYESSSRALCRLSKAPGSVEIDGEALAKPTQNLVLPRGQHLVVIRP